MKKPAKKKSAPRKAKAAARAKPAAKPKLKPLAPALGKLVDAATGTPFGPTKAEARSHRSDMLKLQSSLKPAERKELLRLAPRPADTRWPSEIIVGKRFRRDMGDLDALARSIEKRTRDGNPGLQQPIGLNPKGELIWGERRLLAWKRADVALAHPIPVRVMDISSIIVGEYVENDPKLRKNFSPSESVEIFEAMRPRERELVGAELAARPTEQRPAPGRKASGPKAGRAADRAAKFVGKDRKTIAKAKDVVDAARADPKYQPLVEQMDRTGKVDGPHRRLKIMRQTEAIRAAPPQWPVGDHRYETVVIDFPWPHEPEMDQEQIDAAGRSLRPYPAMSIKNGAHFMREQLGPRLAEKCTVYFWSTNYHLPWAEHLLGALGFTKPSTMGTWAKDQVGRGQVLRDQTEQCIVRHRGGALIAETMDTTLWQGAGWETRENSRKPQAFYDLVERKSPAPRYLSVFSRGGEGDKWDSYGDQAEVFAAPAAAGDEQEEWRALWAVEAGVTIEGPIFTILQEGRLIAGDTGRPNGWTLTSTGADRLAELDKRFNVPGVLPAEPIESRDRLLLRVLGAVEQDPGTKLEEDWLRPGGLLDSLVDGKRKRKLTPKGKDLLKDLQRHACLAWLEAVAAGRGAELAEPTRKILLAAKFVVGGRASKLSRAGERELESLRKDKAERDELAAMPDNVDELVVLYGQAIRDHQEAVLASDRAGVERLDRRIDLLQMKANGGTNFGMGTDESPAERLRVENRPPVGEVPMWAQPGIFRIVVDDMPVIVHYEHDDFFGGTFDFHAEDGARPFCSESGYQTEYGDFHLGDDVPDDGPRVALGVTVAQHAEVIVRQLLVTVSNKSGSGRVPRTAKHPLPMPATWYRMPASWDEVDFGPPVAGGELLGKRQRLSKRKKSPPPADPQPAGRAGGNAPSENENLPLYRTDPQVIDAITALGGHVISMTTDWSVGENGTSVATCECGFIARVERDGVASASDMERRTEAHWRERLAAHAPTVDRVNRASAPEGHKLFTFICAATDRHEATCACGTAFSAPSEGFLRMESDIVAHWESVRPVDEPQDAGPMPEFLRRDKPVEAA